jgi:hypothetical protein
MPNHLRSRSLESPPRIASFSAGKYLLISVDVGKLSEVSDQQVDLRLQVRVGPVVTAAIAVAVKATKST